MLYCKTIKRFLMISHRRISTLRSGAVNFLSCQSKLYSSLQLNKKIPCYSIMHFYFDTINISNVLNNIVKILKSMQKTLHNVGFVYSNLC